MKAFETCAIETKQSTGTAKPKKPISCLCHVLNVLRGALLDAPGLLHHLLFARICRLGRWRSVWIRLCGCGYGRKSIFSHSLWFGRALRSGEVVVIERWRAGTREH